MHRVCVLCGHVGQSTIDEMRHQEVELQFQMKEQCEDYKELLSEKMARDMEISAYRSVLTLRVGAEVHIQLLPFH